MIPIDDLVEQIKANKRRNMLIWCSENLRRMTVEVERECGSDHALPLAVALQRIDKLRRASQPATESVQGGSR